MKTTTLLLSLLASTTLASARITATPHALAIAAALIPNQVTALALPSWAQLIHTRQANSTYTVVSGDTLNSIAASINTTVAALEAANPDVVPTDLQVGQVLNLPTSGSASGNSTSTSALQAIESDTAEASTIDSHTGTTAVEGTHQFNATGGCGGGHHHQNGTHHNGTSTDANHAHNGTEHAHNGTSTASHHFNGTEHAHNGTFHEDAGECNATTGGHHHHNGTGTATGTGAAAATFFVASTATASALSTALTEAPVGKRAVEKVWGSLLGF